MSTPEHTVIGDYVTQLMDLGIQKAAIEKRAQLIEKAVRALIDLVDEEDERLRLLEILDEVARPVGLTNAVRSALQTAAGQPLTPREVRDKVPMLLIGHSNPLASVHTVLKRLARSENVRTVEKDGSTAYQWVNAATLARSRFARVLTARPVPKPVVK